MSDLNNMQTMGDFLDKQCQYYDDLTAIHGVRDDRPIRITFGKLRQLAFEIAGGMIHKGIRPGDPVCIFSDSTIEWVLVFMATQFIGAVDVSYESNRDQRQMCDIVNRVDARMVFCDHFEMLQEVSQEFKIPMVDLSWSTKTHDQYPNTINLKTLHLEGKKKIGLQKRVTQLRLERGVRSTCSIFFKKSNGVEKPRGVVHSHESLIRNINDFTYTIESGEKDKILSTLPLWHSSGRLVLLLCFYKASSLFLSDEAGFLDDVMRVSPDIMFTNSISLTHFYIKVKSGISDENQFHTLFRRLYLKASLAWNFIMDFIFQGQIDPSKNRFSFIFSSILLLIPLWLILGPVKYIGKKFYQADILDQLSNQLRLIVCGGMKLPSRIDDFYRTLGINVFESYWFTEAGFVVATMSTEMTGQTENSERGTVGMMLSGMELKLIDQKGEDVSTQINIPAQIYIKGDNVMRGYLNEPKLTSETLDANGWLRTGDRGILIANGNLKLLPRQSRFSKV